jgi:DNA-directed RNA polymerase subunit omega
MARVTIEDCLEQIPSRYKLTIVAFKRIKQLLKGAKPVVDPERNKLTVVALKEIAAGKITIVDPETEEYF